MIAEFRGAHALATRSTLGAAKPEAGSMPAGRRPQRLERCRRRRAAISPASATTRRCAGRARSCRSCASARSRPRTRACSDPRHRAAAARDRAVPLPPAEGVRRHGARLRGRGRHPGGDRARLPVDGLERRQPRLPPLDPRLLRPRDPARGVGRQPGCADRLVDRARRRPRAQGRRRVHRQRPLAVLLRRRQLGLEHAGRHRLRRRRQDRGRLAAVPGAEVRLRDHRHLVRHGHGRPPAARTSRSPSCSCRSAARWRCSAAAAGSSIRAPRSTPARSIAFRSWRPPAIRWRPPAVGAAEGAYELFLASMAKRAGTYTGAKVADFQAVQIKVARARCLIDSARQLLRQSAIAFQDGGGAQRGAGPGDQAALPRAVGLRRQPGARGGGDAVVVLRRAGPLHARSAAAAPARRAWPSPSISRSTSTSPARPSASTRWAARMPIRRCEGPIGFDVASCSNCADTEGNWARILMADVTDIEGASS